MPPLSSGKKPSIYSTLRHTIRKTGVRSMYTGLSASLMRQMSYSLVRIGSYESIKRYMTQGSSLWPKCLVFSTFD